MKDEEFEYEIINISFSHNGDDFLYAFFDVKRNSDCVVRPLTAVVSGKATKVSSHDFVEKIMVEEATIRAFPKNCQIEHRFNAFNSNVNWTIKVSKPLDVDEITKLLTEYKPYILKVKEYLKETALGEEIYCSCPF